MSPTLLSTAVSLFSSFSNMREREWRLHERERERERLSPPPPVLQCESGRVVSSERERERHYIS
jgi:hypothetical protein